MNTSELGPVIEVNEDKCVNCHMCISACPVKFCIDGSGDKVRINHALCIGCGSCITACTHEARRGIDSTEAFFAALARRDPMIAIVAPAVAARFPGQLLRFNGWLKSLGLRAVFDVSFGAELTVASYLRHLAAKKPRMIIAQPCPVVVSYLELYQPELLPYLAPADSPMMHTIKMIREFRPEHRNAKIAVISPCVAKLREFEEVGMGDFNVTLEKLVRRMEEARVDLRAWPETEFDNPPAERAVLFSSPGGLKRTIERDAPELGGGIRKVEGRGLIDYLRELPGSVAAKANPLVLDCLNCEKGCNGGTGTGSSRTPTDILETAVEERRKAQAKKPSGRGWFTASPAKSMGRLLKDYWKPGLYDRSYPDRSKSYLIRKPNASELEAVYRALRKFKSEDFLDCAACGYNSCEMMATAIFNGLNKPQNCHHYKTSSIAEMSLTLRENSLRLNGQIQKSTAMLRELLDLLPVLESQSQGGGIAVQQSSAAVEELVASLTATSAVAERRRDALEGLVGGSRKGEESLSRSLEATEKMAAGVEDVLGLVLGINKIAAQTNLLAMNAAIEAAHAGEAGRGFAVVADEIRNLSVQAGSSATRIGKTLKTLAAEIKDVTRLSGETGSTIRGVLVGTQETTTGLLEIFQGLSEMSSGTGQLMTAISELAALIRENHESYLDMGMNLRKIVAEIEGIAAISESNAALAEG
jgi:Na+-translocating ferredoxin:NAD+ oxidoreductase RNF subunit RnfB